jgi:hypothetical protein
MVRGSEEGQLGQAEVWGGIYAGWRGCQSGKQNCRAALGTRVVEPKPPVLPLSLLKCPLHKVTKEKGNTFSLV